MEPRGWFVAASTAFRGVLPLIGDADLNRPGLGGLGHPGPAGAHLPGISHRGEPPRGRHSGDADRRTPHPGLHPGRPYDAAGLPTHPRLRTDRPRPGPGPRSPGRSRRGQCRGSFRRLSRPGGRPVHADRRSRGPVRGAPCPHRPGAAPARLLCAVTVPAVGHGFSGQGCFGYRPRISERTCR